MPLEAVLVIIMGVASVGHMATDGAHSGIHSKPSVEIDAERVDCIKAVKESFDYETREGEELVGDIESMCYSDGDE